MDMLEMLKTERDKAAQQVSALDTAIRTLGRLNSTRVSHGPRKMSAAARARISASQKARWARARAGRLTQSLPSVASRQQDWRGLELHNGHGGQRREPGRSKSAELRD